MTKQTFGKPTDEIDRNKQKQTNIDIAAHHEYSRIVFTNESAEKRPPWQLFHNFLEVTTFVSGCQKLMPCPESQDVDL